MDEIVFQRERLRRELTAQIELIDKAAESYDPEADIPIDDFAAAFVIASGTRARGEYADAVAHRVKMRAPSQEPGA